MNISPGGQSPRPYCSSQSSTAVHLRVSIPSTHPDCKRIHQQIRVQSPPHLPRPGYAWKSLISDPTSTISVYYHADIEFLPTMLLSSLFPPPPYLHSDNQIATLPAPRRKRLLQHPRRIRPNPLPIPRLPIPLVGNHRPRHPPDRSRLSIKRKAFSMPLDGHPPSSTTTNSDRLTSTENRRGFESDVSMLLGVQVFLGNVWRLISGFVTWSIRRCKRREK